MLYDFRVKHILVQRAAFADFRGQHRGKISFSSEKVVVRYQAQSVHRKTDSVTLLKQVMDLSLIGKADHESCITYSDYNRAYQGEIRQHIHVHTVQTESLVLRE